MQVSYHFRNLLTCSFWKSKALRPRRSASIWFSKCAYQELSKMVWHLHIGWKLRSLETLEVLTQIYPNSVKKFEPLERPLLEVRRFFQWCQGMPLGVLMRFQERKDNFFFRVWNFCATFRRLLHYLVQFDIELYFM